MSKTTDKIGITLTLLKLPQFTFLRFLQFRVSSWCLTFHKTLLLVYKTIHKTNCLTLIVSKRGAIIAGHIRASGFTARYLWLTNINHFPSSSHKLVWCHVSTKIDVVTKSAKGKHLQKGFRGFMSYGIKKKEGKLLITLYYFLVSLNLITCIAECLTLIYWFKK